MKNNNILTYTQYIKKARELDNNKSNRKLKNLSVCFFSNFTAELMEPFIKVEFSNIGYKANIKYFTYGKIEDEIFNKKKFTQDLIFLHFRTEDIFRDLCSQLLKEKKSVLISKVKKKLKYYEMLLKKLREKSDALIFISNFAETKIRLLYTLQSNMNITQSELINIINKQLRDITKETPSTYIYDYQNFVQEHGFSNIYDSKLWHMSKNPFKLEYQDKIVKSYLNTIKATMKPPKKCLVCDLDNTLWGGVLGEGRMETVQLGEEFPGNIYKDFQKDILDLRNTGVFIAIVSKNNLSDVINFINNNEDCLIKEKHCSVIKANWEDKAKNILEISRELNIGLDSIVFFDDSPVEREWVTKQLPEVHVLDVPENPIHYKNTLLESGLFDKVSITNEDIKRSALFEDEKKRRTHEKLFHNYNDFIINLKMTITIKKVSTDEVKRVTQLINKVNQFNITGKRKDENDVINTINSKDQIFGVRLKDKFGDFGLVGVVALKWIEKDIWEIDNFLLSCRALGRKVENIIMQYLLNYLFKIKSKKVFGKFTESDKNIVAKDFYKNMDFKYCNNKKDWSISFNSFKPKKINYGKVVFIDK